MAAEMTKAGLAAQLGAEIAGNGGNGASEPAGAEVPEAEAYGLPGVEAGNEAAPAAPSTFGRKPKTPAPSPAGVAAQLGRALPPPQQVRISKRLEGGKYGFIGSYSPAEIGPETGAWQVFIKRHLKQWIAPGENWFQIESLDANGKLRNHGEHPIMGDTVTAAPGFGGTTIYPPATDTVRDQIAAMREMEELTEKRRKAWMEEQARIRKETEDAQATLEAASKSKGDPMLTFMLMQSLRQPHTPPLRDPRDEEEFLERRIDRKMDSKLAPIAAGFNSVVERLERLQQAVANPPPPPLPMQPPPDPMLAVAKIIEAVKPPPPPPPAPAAPPEFTMRDIVQMQRDAEARMERLMTAMKPEPPKETFGLRDWIQMQQTQEDRTQRLIERLEANTEKRLADLKELARDKPAAKGTLEALREAKEIAGLLGGESAPSGVFEKLLEVVGTPEVWQGFGDFIATVKGGGQVEEEQEEQPIEVNERAPQAASPARQAAHPPQAAHPSRPQGAPAVKPADMGLTDYPDTLAPAVAQLIEVSAAEATDADGTQAQIVAVMGCLQAVMNGSPEWKRRVYTGLRRVAFGGPKQVTVWIGPFLRGLAKSGKITLSSSEVLLRVVEVNSEAIVVWIKRKMQKPAAPQPPSTQ